MGAEDIDERRVELGAGCDPNHSQGNMVSKIIFGNIGYPDGIEGVGDRQDSGAQRDISSSDTVGVAGSIPSLVMMGDEDRRVLQEGKGCK